MSSPTMIPKSEQSGKKYSRGFALIEIPTPGAISPGQNPYEDY